MATAPETYADPAPEPLMRYSTFAVAFHWLMVALILIQVGLGFAFHRFLERGTPERMEVFTWHKTIGATILILTLIRLFYRLINPPPAYPEDMPEWRRTAAVWSHRLLYFLMIALPLTGLIAVSDRGPATALIGGFPLPTIPGITEATGDMFGEVHVVLVWTTIALLVVHIAAAFYEQFLARHGVAGRMPPFQPQHGEPRAIGQGTHAGGYSGNL